jgi:hypothetical protein
VQDGFFTFCLAGWLRQGGDSRRVDSLKEKKKKNKTLESGVDLEFFCVGSKDVLEIPSFIPLLGA